MEAWDIYRSQLYLGMPWAMPTHHLDQVARYGFRGWRGLTFGHSRRIGEAALERTGKWGSKAGRVVNRYVPYIHQALGGGMGPQKQFMSGGKPMGSFGLSVSERAAIKDLWPKGKITKGKIDYPTVFNRVNERIIQASERMTLRQSITGMATGSNALIDKIAREELGKKGASLLSGATTRRASMAAFAGVGLKPLLGIWNVATVGLIAAQVGEGVVRVGMHAMKSIQQYSMGIPRLDMGGDVSSFHTGLATTERQRAIQAIQGGMYNARMAIGNEAAFLHS